MPNEIFDAKYEEIIESPEKKIKELLSFCSLDFEKECLKFYETKRPIKTVSSNPGKTTFIRSSYIFV